MAQVSPEFPKIEPTDPENVVIALQRAHALLGAGDVPEAVRWLRRAAEQAEREGNDLRAVELARLAADFATPLAPSNRPSSLSPASDDEAAALAAFEDFSDQTVVDAPGTLGPREVQHSRIQIQAGTEMEPAAPTTRSSPATPPSKLTRAEPQPRQALRVAVSRVRQADGSWRVVPLAEGAAPPSDAVEAILVPLNPTIDLLRR